MKNISFIIIILLSIVGNAYAGGPWPQKKGKGYYKLSEWWTIFDEHYTDQGFKDPNVTTGIFNTTFYGEYGFNDRLTGTWNAILFSRNYMNNVRSQTRPDDIITLGEAINTFGDIELGVKYGLVTGKFPVSVSLVLGIPTGKTGRGAEGNLATSDGEFNQILQVDSGFGFNVGENNSGYVSGYVGINHRTEEFSEEFRYGLEAGIGLVNNRVWLATKLNVIESFKNGSTAENNSSTSIFANNTEFTSLTFETNLYVTPKFGVSLGTAVALSGEIIAAASSYNVGVFLDLSK